ncbi:MULTISPECIES: MFS transporter [unclassified Novosphingobium]|uniref:MFS transporter n=1 Tax=unclassified Novosphingobium TaxID=2644732 RepID=UPI001494B116|nr:MULTISPECIES: MFS transporter [unclassified Novosphingobium]MBB3359751.1 UMF1 family MFS transporter [Novosphingobium sp. BK256]MBB3376110.1 UMF1 family MFS transporter [Novosphingobium sp. BK280]MBB3380524.1 UMF1 family MFS transporter [Novosphingobium sp. BK258]MBB3422175.1 UMF1 family MFS transporter [Novosphingobium sp. BK267]MBB3450969.1 UMF1 family MFS transporter [Novosphingobium sp. BK352]
MLDVAAPSGAEAHDRSGAPDDKGKRLAWALYECARNPFYVLINIYVFSAYFANHVIADPVQGQAVWGYILSTAAVFVALSAPVLGTIADAGGRRKPFLAASILIAVPACGLLALARPGMGSGILLIAACLVVANICYELSSIFYNALLAQVSSPRRYGSASGLAYALANGAGILLFGTYMLADFMIAPATGNFLVERATPLVVAGWWQVFSLPILVLVPDAASTGAPLATIVRQGLRRLRTAIGRLRAMPDVGRYLIARMVFNEGFIVLMMFMGVVGAGVLGWTGVQLSAMGLVLSVVAVGGSVLGGFLDERLGSKMSLQIGIVGCIFANLLLVTIGPDTVLFVATDPHASGGLFPRAADKAFFVAEGLAAFFVTAGLVSSRVMLAKLAPRDAMNELFGIYALSGTATSFLGPLSIAVLTQLFASQRAGLCAGIAFLTCGLVLLGRVQSGHASPA